MLSQNRAGGNAADMVGGCSLRAQRGKIITNAAALLHCERALLERIKNPFQRIFNGAHDKTVAKRDLSIGAGTCQDAATGQEQKPAQNVIETLFPFGFIRLFDTGQRPGHPSPAIFDALLAGRIVGVKAIFTLPDLTGDAGVKDVAAIFVR